MMLKSIRILNCNRISNIEPVFRATTRIRHVKDQVTISDELIACPLKKMRLNTLTIFFGIYINFADGAGSAKTGTVDNISPFISSQ